MLAISTSTFAIIYSNGDLSINGHLDSKYIAAARPIMALAEMVMKVIEGA